MNAVERQMVLALHHSGVPSSHIARRLSLPRREVNHVIKEGAMPPKGSGRAPCGEVRR